MSVKVKLCYGCNQLSSFDYTCIECEYVRDFCRIGGGKVNPSASLN